MLRTATRAAAVTLTGALLVVGLGEVHERRQDAALAAVVAAQDRVVAAAEQARTARAERVTRAATARLTGDAVRFAAVRRTEALDAAHSAVRSAEAVVVSSRATPDVPVETLTPLGEATARLVALIDATPDVPATLSRPTRVPAGTIRSDAGLPTGSGRRPVPAAHAQPRMADDVATTPAAAAVVAAPGEAAVAAGPTPAPPAVAPAAGPGPAAVPAAGAEDPARRSPRPSPTTDDPTTVPDADDPTADDPTTDPTAGPPPVPTDDPAARPGTGAAPAGPAPTDIGAPTSPAVAGAATLRTLDLGVSAEVLAAARQVAELSVQVRSAADAAVAAAQAERAAQEAVARAAAALAERVAAADTAPNGQIPTELLCAPRVARDELLRCDAADALDRLAAAYRADVGRDLVVVSSYRSFDAQVAVKAARGYLAAPPGRSNHGRAVAVDFGGFGGVGEFTAPAYLWMKEHAAQFGWHHPAAMEPGGSAPQEPWHWEFGTED